MRATDIDGEDMGTFQPIQFESGQLGWQGVDDDGQLLGVVFQDGYYGSPYESTSHSWELVPETAQHRDILDCVEADGDMFFVR